MKQLEKLPLPIALTKRNLPAGTITKLGEMLLKKLIEKREKEKNKK